MRSILGRESVDGTLAEAVGLQYWDDNANTYLCLSVQPEQLACNACHEMSHIIDSRVLTFCKAYDDWEKLNPKGFQYNYGSVSDLSVADRRWTVSSDRAFLDLYSMTYPKEDRARIMEYAMADGYEASFRSETNLRKTAPMGAVSGNTFVSVTNNTAAADFLLAAAVFSISVFLPVPFCFSSCPATARIFHQYPHSGKRLLPELPACESPHRKAWESVKSHSLSNRILKYPW